jgi:VanZ family protein
LSALAPVAGWLGVIAVGSSSAAAHGRMTGWAIAQLSRWFPGLALDSAACTQLSTVLLDLRKPAHLLEYAVLALLVYRAATMLAPGSRRRSLAAAIVCCGLVGALDEFHQSFDPTRTGAVRDVLVDVLGGALGLACAAEVRRWRERRRRSCPPPSS